MMGLRQPWAAARSRATCPFSGSMTQASRRGPAGNPASVSVLLSTAATAGRGAGRRTARSAAAGTPAGAPGKAVELARTVIVDRAHGFLAVGRAEHPPGNQVARIGHHEIEIGGVGAAEIAHRQVMGVVL